ncbi:MAG: transcriptional repressor LexA [Alphaproteobacteria bacterium]|nr:transcriptional repressor LexA [Alphaproteobacteria bacterium]MBP7757744.1 transcriptional repressor LexA [Alphaproteobacteria bacterium]MBP7761056.1 transcriptional repressor LexA [Alphaproteobacteria bacterium]MBP7904570.1 transcriptional repressor LexA [Alphaproteobacteria bacterium]
MLTQKQRDLLYFIHDKMRKDDVPPSFEEMKEALGLKSKSGIHRLISALVERGFIERLPHRARALEIKRLPEGIGQKPTATSKKSSGRLPTAAVPFFDEVPLFGKIAAGTPIEAIRDEGHSFSLPSGFLGRGDHYALTIEGDSMVNAGIFDGDTVIIRRCDTAENGTIVVALVDDHEATLKRLRRAGRKIVLEPENENYEPRVLETDRVKIQGRLAHLIRRYD